MVNLPGYKLVFLRELWLSMEHKQWVSASAPSHNESHLGLNPVRSDGLPSLGLKPGFLRCVRGLSTLPLSYPNCELVNNAQWGRE